MQKIFSIYKYLKCFVYIYIGINVLFIKIFIKEFKWEKKILDHKLFHEKYEIFAKIQHVYQLQNNMKQSQQATNKICIVLNAYFIKFFSLSFLF